MRTIRHIFLFIVAIFIAQGVFSQNVSVKASIDSTLILIGKQSHLTFEVAQPKNVNVLFPVITDTLINGVDVVARTKPDTTDLGHGRIQVRQVYTITSFDTALYYIPPYDFINGKDTFKTTPLGFKVLTYSIDTTRQSIFDIKHIIMPPFDWIHLWEIVFLILLILLLLILGGYYLWKRVLKKPIPFIKVPERILSPYEAAIEALNEISHKKIWQQGREKEYYTQLTDALRNYIEGRFNIPALEMTSSDLLDETKYFQKEYPAAYDSLKKVLQVSDLVKFAKWHPMPDENELSLNLCYLFVNQTKEEEVVPPENAPVLSGEKQTDNHQSDKSN
ncbi:hypothetical protein [Microbacter margulisiae]|uniref:Oxygen tolerance n=1 Tax=Microbacter margulisiae TaxID=1350067 RepID=A0A7W5DR12_9PORP|nr:hypothetical protein [Microbacter margulisiae]MBB3187155.1 hypothetical protein [Microbacter margulisiae]